MNGKQSKKLRQLYTRDYRREESKFVTKMRRLLKPRPWYIPKWLWRKMFTMLLRTEQ